MGITLRGDRDPNGIRGTVTEFERWVEEQGRTLRPAFEWRFADSVNEGTGRIVTPLVTLAVYDDNEKRLQMVYPHGDGEEVWTVHDGIEALESTAEDAERSEGGTSENLAAPLS